MKALFIALAFFSLHASAQQNQNGDEAPFNKFSIDVLAPLHFGYSTTSELFQQKVIYNAIRLNMKIKQEGIGVFGQVSFHTVTPSAFSNKLAIALKYTDSPNAVAPAGDVILSQNPVMLFSQPGGSKSTKHYKYLFDLKLNPPSSFEGLESQSFSIIYTFSIL